MIRVVVVYVAMLVAVGRLDGWFDIVNVNLIKPHATHGWIKLANLFVYNANTASFMCDINSRVLSNRIV